ncbi:MAG: pyrroline-5-carboxylate reductase [Candidatus Omnitrophota bacterium]|nr:pyrroline-5-carboxylate reductase [Candidatus Omnitrophota bacterium]
MIGIIGAGNMGMAIASGLRERFLVSDEDLSKLKAIKNRKVSIARSNIDLARQSNVIILAVKPQDIGKVLKEIKPHIKEKLIISIAAGVKTGSMEKALGKVAIIRVMPNMPAMVGKGISAISRGRFAGLSDFKTASRIFSNVGEIVEVKENMMDAVTAVSGSGPAYYFLFTYLLQKAAQASGLKKDIAVKLARAVFIGAAEIVKSKDLSMEELVEKVASKGGTTEAALKVFKNKKLGNIIEQAVKSASLKSSNVTKRV